MKENRLVWMITMAIFIGAFACSPSKSTTTVTPPGGSTGGGGGGDGGGGGGATTAAYISLTATPSTISSVGTTSITAVVLDSTQSPVPVGTEVNFSVSPDYAGSVTPELATTTQSGVAYTTFYSSGQYNGDVYIYASSGSAQASVKVNILPPEIASIVFVSADPTVIDLYGSGGQSTAIVKFRVLDSSGNPVQGVPVSFTLIGPSPSGVTPIEYLDPLSTTTDANGYAHTVLTSGIIAGPARIIATATDLNTGKIIQASSTPISIGGGVPSHKHFSLAAKQLNISGLRWYGLHDKITAFVADRFSNIIRTPVTVSFFAEAGAIQTSATTDPDYGSATVVLQSQAPLPRDESPLPKTEAQTFPPDGYPAFSTGCVQAYYDGTWYYRTFNPRDGYLRIIAVTKGEETFFDSNANGVYDQGEDWIDIGEPFIDANDNGIWDDAEPYVDGDGDGRFTPPEPFADANENCLYDPGDESFTDLDGDGVYDYGDSFTDVNNNGRWDPAEFYFDANNNGKYDGPNGKWDSNTSIWTDMNIIFSGGAWVDYDFYVCNADCSTGCYVSAPTVPAGKCGVIKMLLRDHNYNPPPFVLSFKIGSATYWKDYECGPGSRCVFLPLHGMTFPSTGTNLANVEYDKISVEWEEGDGDTIINTYKWELDGLSVWFNVP